MQDHEKVDDDKDGIDHQFDQERPQRASWYGSHRNSRFFGIWPVFSCRLWAVSSIYKYPLRERSFVLTLGDNFTKEMADVANKYPENVEGKFYVDDQCIDCDLCRETAPANFKRNDDGGHSFVYKQPESPDEESLCKEAMEGCPVEAIGNDGS